VTDAELLTALVALDWQRVKRSENEYVVKGRTIPPLVHDAVAKRIGLAPGMAGGMVAATRLILGGYRYWLLGSIVLCRERCEDR
jgi:hypothetical protein